MADYSGAFAAVVLCVIAATYLIYWLSSNSLFVVKHAEVMIVERFGKFKCILEPGMHWIWPIIEAPRVIDWRVTQAKGTAEESTVHLKTNRVDLREHLLDLGVQTAITRDTVQCDVDSLVYFRIVDAQKAVYAVQQLPDAIELLVQATLRQVIAGLSLDDTFSSREAINEALLRRVARDSERWGVVITRVEVVSIMPPTDVQGAMENQIRAERERRSAVLSADGEREAAIIRSRGQAAQLVLQAEGARAAAVLRAKGAAESRRLLASADAQCLSDIRAAVGPYGGKAVEYLSAVEYLNSLSRLTADGPGGTPGAGSGGRRGGGDSSEVILVPKDSVDVMGRVLANAFKGARGGQ